MVADMNVMALSMTMLPASSTYPSVPGWLTSFGGLVLCCVVGTRFTQTPHSHLTTIEIAKPSLQISELHAERNW